MDLVLTVRNVSASQAADAVGALAPTVTEMVRNEIEVVLDVTP